MMPASETGTSSFEVTRRYYPHFLNYDDQHDEAQWRPVERRVDFDPTLCALMLVDVWNTNEIGFERFDQIVRQRIQPVLAAFRQAGMLVIHAPSPAVANKYPDRRFKPTPPDATSGRCESDTWPTPQMLARTGEFAQYALNMDKPANDTPLSQEELYRNYFIHPAVEPTADDVVVGDRHELHALLTHNRKFHLFYVGFASNGCIQERDYGIKQMGAYDITLIRDCTAALEMAHTVATLEQTRASIENMEWWISTCSSADLLAGLHRMRQATGEQGDPPVSHVGKRRRIILNDDGDALWHANAKSPEAFLAKRFKQATGTQVDTYIYYVGDGWHPHCGRKPDPGLGDPNKVIVDAAHREGMEIFASLRMNDIHCSFSGEALSPLKHERPDVLIGDAFAQQQYPHLLEGEQGIPTGGSTGGYPLGLMQAFWAGLNFAKPEVRELRRARVEEVATKYDFDGFELDFFRHPLFFKPGEDRENLAVMTDLVRQIRSTLNKVAMQRGRPYLLAVRVPDTPEMALRTGLDVHTWLEEGLVDVLMVAGGYMPFSSRIKAFIDMAHLYGVPAYPLVDIGAWYSESEKEFKKPPPHAVALDFHCQPDKIRAITSNFWALGGDGVYLFNWYGLPEQATEELALLDQVGDVETLRNVNKRFQPDNGCDDWMTYCGYTVAPRQFPIRLIDGIPVELIVGDDVQKAAEERKIDSLELRIEVANMHVSEGIYVTINGTPVPLADVRRTDEWTFQAGLSAPLLRRGINEIIMLPGKGSVGRVSSKVTWAELSVVYR